jgi:hypothetical protein
VEHDDALQTTVRALFNDIKAARLGVAVGINNIPGIAGDSVELVEAARLDDSAAGDRLMEFSHESPNAVVTAEPSVFVVVNRPVLERRARTSPGLGDHAPHLVGGKRAQRRGTEVALRSKPQ